MNNIEVEAKFEYKKRHQLLLLCLEYFVDGKLQAKEWNQGWAKNGLDKSEHWARKDVLEVLIRKGVFEKMKKIIRESNSGSVRFEGRSDAEVIFVEMLKKFYEFLSAFHDDFSDKDNSPEIIDLMFNFNRKLQQVDTELSEAASFQEVDWKIMLKAVSMWMQIDSLIEHNQELDHIRTKFTELKETKKDDFETHQKVNEFKLFAFKHDDHVEVTQNVVERVLDFVVKLINRCDQIEDMFPLVMMLERWCPGKVISQNQKEEIRNALEAQVNSCEIDNSILKITKENADLYRAKFCCHWLIDNILRLQDTVFPKIPLVKLSPNRLNARNEYFETPFVRSPFPVIAGTFFYEVTVISTEKVLASTYVGWTGRISKTIREGGSFVGMSDPSIGLNVNIKAVLQNGMHRLFGSSDNLAQPGDVVGCAINMDKAKFSFFFNGHFIIETSFDKSTLPYFATASLGYGQQCHFNFGQEQFKYKPKFRYLDFHTACDKNPAKYRFMEVQRAYNGTYWQKQEVFQNRMQLFFTDQAQYYFNVMIKSFEIEIRDGKVAHYGLILHFGDSFRLFQSILEVLQLDNEKMVYLFADWFHHYLRIFFTWIRSSEFCEILYPYLQLEFTEESKCKHMNICIVLAHLIGCFNDDDFPVLDPIQPLVFEYFIRMFRDSDNKWTKLFSTICIDELGCLSEEQRVSVCAEMNQILDWKKTSFEQTSIFDALNANRENLYNYQFYFLAKQLTGSNTLASPSHKVQATLHPMDKTRYIKLTTDLFSARNDSAIWQSVRSVCSVTKGEIAYYEVIFLAPSEFRIGWATKNLNLNDQLGNDQTSIGFERLYNLICYQDKTYKLEENLIPWSAGEVIGCLIDLTDKNEGKISFTINGKQIVSPIEIKLPTTEPYHAAVSLAPHQHWVFNFGQTDFRYASKVILFTNLYQRAQNVIQTEIEGQHTAISIGNVNNSLVMIHSKLKARDITIETTNIIKENTIQVSKSDRPPPICKICEEKDELKLFLFMCCKQLVVCHNCKSSISRCPKCKFING